MKSRLRWYCVNPIDRLLSSLTTAIGKERFRADTADGFVTERASSSRIRGAYIERLAVEDRVEDPFGSVSIYQRVEYRRTAFSLGTDYPELELRNAPRTYRAFLARLGQLAGHEAAIEPVALDVMSFVKHLEEVVGRVSVSRLVISGYPLSPRASADVVVTGAEDVRDEAKRFTANRFTAVAAATVSWHRRSEQVECDISVGGVAFDDERGDWVERVLHQALRSSRQSVRAR